MTGHERKTTCCVVGGGPAGMMLGYLLARQGLPVTVLEMHKDFFRDFRGDTVHPSTLEVLHELGLLDEFLKLPHQEIHSVGAAFGDLSFHIADFRHVPGVCKFTALMPQWDFLNFLSSHAKRLAPFELLMEHEVTDLIREGDRIAGVVARGPGDTTVHVRSDLVVGCDGRHAITRSAGQLELIEFGVPIDVLWFRISRQPGDPEQVLGNVNYGMALILINRNDYFQAGLIIRKGTFEEIKRRGMQEFRRALQQLAPYFGDRVNELHDWDHIKLLTVQINRLKRWYRQGLLCIGDAAHAMSPAGGVGINLAIQDAVATANLLARTLQHGTTSEATLAAVQRRREFPTRMTQAAQVAIHKAFDVVFESHGPVRAPWQLKAAVQIPGIQQALGYVVGIGFRREHISRTEHPRGHKPNWRLAAGAALGLVAAILAWRSLKPRFTGI